MRRSGADLDSAPWRPVPAKYEPPASGDNSDVVNARFVVAVYKSVHGSPSVLAGFGVEHVVVRLVEDRNRITNPILRAVVRNQPKVRGPRGPCRIRRRAGLQKLKVTDLLALAGDDEGVMDDLFLEADDLGEAQAG